MNSVSVILPNYNYAQYLPQRIESILNQSYTDFELLILDDASTDHSVEIIEEYKRHDKRIKTYYNKENSGSPFIQWDKGIKVSKGELIWIAEADDYGEPDFLIKTISQLNDDVGVSYASSKLVDQNCNELGYWHNKVPEERNYLFENNFVMNGRQFIAEQMIFQNVIPNASAVIFSKSLYNKIGGVNLNIRNCTDWLLWIKMLYYTNIAYLAEPLNYFRRHASSVINTIESKSAKEDVFHEHFSSTMRKEINHWLPDNETNNKIKKINSRYIAKDLGIKISWAKRRGSYFEALKYGLQAFSYSGGNINYLKKLLA